MLPTKYASILKRFAAFVIDVVLTLGVAGIVIKSLVMLQPDLCSVVTHKWFFLENGFEEFNELFPIPVFVVTIIFHKIFCWFYFSIFQSSARQASPGKMMLGLFVTDIQGRRISFARAFGRELGRELSQLICWLGYVVALFTPRKQALHDLIAGTLVLEPSAPINQAIHDIPDAAAADGSAAGNDQPEQERN